MNDQPVNNPYQSPNQQTPYSQSPEPATPPANDGFAIASMILGIIGLITCFLGIIFGGLAVIFGHLSISRINKSPQIKSGKGMAIAGLVTGYISLLLFIFLVFGSIENGNSAYDLFQEGFQEEFEAELERQRQEEQGRELIPDQE